MGVILARLKPAKIGVLSDLTEKNVVDLSSV
jgi:hypothetical protein